MAREFKPTGDERLDRLQRVVIAALQWRPEDKGATMALAAALSNPARLIADIESLRGALTRTPRQSLEDRNTWPRKS